MKLRFVFIAGEVKRHNSNELHVCILLLLAQGESLPITFSTTSFQHNNWNGLTCEMNVEEILINKQKAIKSRRSPNDVDSFVYDKCNVLMTVCTLHLASVAMHIAHPHQEKRLKQLPSFAYETALLFAIFFV